MEKEEELEVINIEDFFTADHEEEGVWFEPRIKGVGCGFEFLVTGTGTDKNIAETERYEKKLAEIKKIKDLEEAAKQRKIAEANRVAEFIKDFRAVEGKQLKYGGKPLAFSIPFMQQLLLKSQPLREAIIAFAVDPTNFIKRENNA